ncbi:MAG: ferrous iron transport protein B, partial [Muribaculaceae bacterium]|nr:ferrous iron transport protein B [Muribaculaceae bacterium]
LFDTIIGVFEGRDKSVRHVHVNLGHEMETAVQALRVLLKKDCDLQHRFSDRYVAIKLLENDSETERIIGATELGPEILALRDKLVASIGRRMDEDVSSIIASEKYGFIAGALAETMERNEAQKNWRTGFIDSVVTSKLFGFPLFFLIMFVTFWLTFALGQYPMDWMQTGVDWLSEAVNNNFPEGILKDLIADGVIGGVGGVIVFLPNILILYCCLSLMEDSGYMARAAFIMDKLMHRIGLHGKSFIPLVMGFGCNVPAIMATRTIESRSSRIITILINPFMSCSARLPLYVLLIGTFFEAHATLVFMGLYVTGIVVAVITAKLLRRFYFKKDETPFVMELPPYRVPTVKAIIRHTWFKGEQYLKKMGGIILVASIVVWALNYFPNHDDTNLPDITESNDIDINHDSFLEMAGKAVQPVMEPLGFHWRASVAALAGVPAKEIVVSTLGVLYTNDETVNDASLRARLTKTQTVTGEPDFTPAAAMAFMVFILLYCPCMATITAIIRETGDWRYGAFSVVYNTLVAWLVAFVVYHVGMMV